MPRLPEPPKTVRNRLAQWISRRIYGADLQPVMAAAHNPKVLMSYTGFERSLAKWNALDPALKSLAVMASAHRIGCSWCTDFGYWQFVSQGVAEATLREVPQWRTSEAFSETERLVMAYAEAMTDDPSAITDDQVEVLRARLGEAALVELTMMVAVENQRSRFNTALGLVSQGFRDRCELADVH